MLDAWIQCVVPYLSCATVYLTEVQYNHQALSLLGRQWWSSQRSWSFFLRKQCKFSFCKHNVQFIFLLSFVFFKQEKEKKLMFTLLFLPVFCLLIIIFLSLVYNSDWLTKPSKVLLLCLVLERFRDLTSHERYMLVPYLTRLSVLASLCFGCFCFYTRNMKSSV